MPAVGRRRRRSRAASWSMIARSFVRACVRAWARTNWSRPIKLLISMRMDGIIWFVAVDDIIWSAGKNGIDATTGEEPKREARARGRGAGTRGRGTGVSSQLHVRAPRAGQLVSRHGRALTSRDTTRTVPATTTLDIKQFLNSVISVNSVRV